jgi:hypothetical protein
MSGRAVAAATAGVGGAAALTVALILALVAAHGQIHCTTIGYANLAPIVIEADAGVGAVAACLGAGCTPVPLRDGGGGTWEVPQEAPYVSDRAAVGQVETVTVRTGSAGGDLTEETFPVVRVPLDARTQCPGPFDYAPVTLADASDAR